MELIDRDKIEFSPIEIYNFDEHKHEVTGIALFKDIEKIPTVKAIAKPVIDDIINKLTDLAEHKIKPISFDQELAINMCINIINKTIAESEKNNDDNRRF